MIDSGGDNYSDAPEKNGGGGERIACGVTAVGQIPDRPAAKTDIPGCPCA